MRVIDPAGRAWTVKRRVLRLPRWRTYRQPDLRVPGQAMLAADLEGLLVGVVLLIVIVLTVAFLWPLVVLLAELAVTLVAVVVRVLLGRWTVVAETAGERVEWPVRGRTRSAALAAQVAAAIRAGEPLAELTASGERRSLRPRFGVRATGSSGHVGVFRR